MNSTQQYDSIVIGGGHAGIEATLALARVGYQVLMLTMDPEAIGRMSCNPAIGGLAKGHIVREIDALGGEMGLAIDATGIQYKMLNMSRGPAVWAPRAQADKERYSFYMRRTLAREPNVDVRKGEAIELLVEGGKCCGVRTSSGETFRSATVIVSTGTFLQGLIHIGEVHYPGGRRDEKPAEGFSDSLRKNGIELVRFKTGTCPRLHADSIDWSGLEEQKGDNPPPPFSYRTDKLVIDQLPCYITHTNLNSHEIIKRNLHRSPLYAGRIVGTGPRYCPSIEDKVVKFPDKNHHQLYLEPEGRDTKQIYVNGLPTSLPSDVQEAVVHSIKGLEHAEILLWGYAIEYDCAPPTQLKHSLETKAVENLFFAGQINCTSGYEEAACQGLVAALNVIRKLRGLGPFVLDRSEAYTAVLIDDLVTRGTNEPYRMFTSRAEFRLLLRQDNADERLMKYGFEFGLISKDVYEKQLERRNKINEELEKLRSIKHENMTLEHCLRRPGIYLKSFNDSGIHSSNLDLVSAHKLETEIKYEGYISRQRIEVNKFRKIEKRLIPDFVDYFSVPGLSREARDKLTKIKPASFGQASRIPGISSCDLSLVSVHMTRIMRERQNKPTG
ncbi:MAG: tRNA uridine-5-carboxymethylaminomethyl(34) synthesis enzyme MnmG [Candidatus Omnitrophica bacterium]|nr:tRNA uridine-5-carboxymethylaminomethyl(34) synthesis enzyme MnmG [Candidatus Omnitrophota bacterium]MDD5670689.1 tRNA uridine-5-carboxymethylaminomethyl(34) synthesis enzyme MnmG [Candidatus Omnitrophota bacterium]